MASVRGDFSRAGKKPYRPGFDRVHQLTRSAQASVAARRQGRAGWCDRRCDRQGRDTTAGRAGPRRGDEVRAQAKDCRLHKLRYGTDATRYRRGEVDCARQGRGAGAEEIRLARRATHHVHQFGDLAPLIDLVAAPDRVIDTMRHMIAQDFFFGTPERGADCTDLRHDVDAIALVLNHAGEAPHLTFNTIESLERCRLAVLCHAVYIPPGGIVYKA